jgi:hypothetical protein
LSRQSAEISLNPSIELNAKLTTGLGRESCSGSSSRIPGKVSDAEPGEREGMASFYIIPVCGS